MLLLNSPGASSSAKPARIPARRGSIRPPRHGLSAFQLPNAPLSLSNGVSMVFQFLFHRCFHLFSTVFNSFSLVFVCLNMVLISLNGFPEEAFELRTPLRHGAGAEEALLGPLGP